MVHVGGSAHGRRCVWQWLQGHTEEKAVYSCTGSTMDNRNCDDDENSKDENGEKGDDDNDDDNDDDDEEEEDGNDDNDDGGNQGAIIPVPK